MSDKKEPEPEITVMTEDEFGLLSGPRILLARLPPNLTLWPKLLTALNNSWRKKTAVLNPFNIRGVSGPVIDATECKEVPKGTTLYQNLKEMQDSGAWTCNAVDHNAPARCSNPKCFKFKHLLPVIVELTPRSK